MKRVKVMGVSVQGLLRTSAKGSLGADWLAGMSRSTTRYNSSLMQLNSQAQASSIIACTQTICSEIGAWPMGIHNLPSAHHGSGYFLKFSRLLSVDGTQMDVLGGFLVDCPQTRVVLSPPLRETLAETGLIPYLGTLTRAVRCQMDLLTRRPDVCTGRTSREMVRDPLECKQLTETTRCLIGGRRSRCW